VVYITLDTLYAVFQWPIIFADLMKYENRNSFLAQNRNPRWRPSAILDLLHHHIGPPTKSFHWATSACHRLSGISTFRINGRRKSDERWAPGLKYGTFTIIPRFNACKCVARKKNGKASCFLPQISMWVYTCAVKLTTLRYHVYVYITEHPSCSSSDENTCYVGVAIDTCIALTQS